VREKLAFFFATSGHSGVDRAMRNLIPAIARRGYPIDLLQVRKHGPTLAEVPAGVRIIDLGSSHVYNSLPAVIRYLRTEKPDVMLSDKDRVNRTAFFARLLAGGRTRLVFSTGTTLSIELAHRDPFDRWLQRLSTGHLYRRASNVIVTSEGVKNDMSAYTGLPLRHIEVVPSPVIPAGLFEGDQPVPDHPWFGKGKPPVVLGVGALDQRKDFATLLRAFSRVRSRRICRLLILGGGREREALMALAAELGVSEDVALPGFESNPYPYMAHAGVFAFTSRWEGLGFVIIEALAVGTPVVATDCPSGPREILDNGRYGRLVSVGDVDALAAGIEASLADRPDKAFLQQAARPYEIEASAGAYLRAMALEDRMPHPAP
jgi:glycosyltransferase involved in cell wall biosynthesis